jgi:hypothetical protein
MSDLIEDGNGPRAASRKLITGLRGWRSSALAQATKVVFRSSGSFNRR